VFDIEASYVRLQKADDPMGRARFVIGSKSVQYRGAAGFLLTGDVPEQYVTWEQLRRLVEQRYFAVHG
jgi:hypothetical protein